MQNQTALQNRLKKKNLHLQNKYQEPFNKKET